MEFIIEDSRGKTLFETQDECVLLGPTDFDMPETLVPRLETWGSVDQSNEFIASRKLTLYVSKGFESDTDYIYFKAKINSFFINNTPPFWLLDTHNQRRTSIKFSKFPEHFDKGNEARIEKEVPLEFILLDVLWESSRESDTGLINLPSGGKIDIRIPDWFIDGHPIIELEAASNLNPDFSIDLYDEEERGFATHRIQCLSFSDTTELNKYMILDSEVGEVRIGGRENINTPIRWSTNNNFWTGGNFIKFKPGLNRLVYTSANNSPVKIRIRHRARKTN
ncbi:phage tail protein [Leptospira stimsonii]|uniref:Phage tail protein n=1 Tax=Leptospira stimsonii TaxID=2202203 RepID=A0ABY2N5S2_9LEPT|nr:phage tail protein [Leptospira stimsonii]TGK12801.1 phage tail protein [Leptospira stimsonii]TGM17452.1 phage tail protein [Leptospira stimsonii]